MSFIMHADGRLAHQPTLSVGKGQPWTEFRLLTNRMSRGEEVTEAVNFVAFGEMAEEFCQRAEKGQLVKAIGTQATDHYTDGQGQERTKVRFILVHFEMGPRPRPRQPEGQGGAQAGNRGGNAQRSNAAPAAPPQRRAPQSPPVRQGEEAPSSEDPSGESPTGFF